MKEEEIEKMKKNFRVLNDWEIEYNYKSKYKGQCNFNKDTKRATIFEHPTEPMDYVLHEMLHIAFAEADTREKKELLIQDICKLIQKENYERKNWKLCCGN